MDYKYVPQVNELITGHYCTSIPNDVVIVHFMTLGVIGFDRGGPEQLCPAFIVHLPVLMNVYKCYPTITYYWTVPLILDRSYLVGNLENSNIAETKALGPLKS
jgi:hypothetical protein